MGFHINSAQIDFDIDILPYYLKTLRITKIKDKNKPTKCAN